MWQNWINALVGAWLVIASLLNMSAATMEMNLLVGGAAVAILGIWSLLESSAGEMHSMQPR